MLGRMPKSVLCLAALAAAGAAAAAIVPGPGRNSRPRPRPEAVPPLAAAGRVLLHEIDAKAAGDWAGSWRTLYPLHRRTAPLAVFVRCERKTPLDLPRSLRVVRIRRAQVHVPGLRDPVRGAAVTLGVELSWYGPRDPIAFRHTFHLVPSRGRWTWLLSSGRYSLYRSSGCGRGPRA